MQTFIATVEESSQQRGGTPPPLDQGVFGGCAGFCVLGQKTTFPVEDQVGGSGKTRLRGKRFLLGRRGGLRCGLTRPQQEQSYDEKERTGLGDPMLESYRPHDAMLVHVVFVRIISRMTVEPYKRMPNPLCSRRFALEQGSRLRGSFAQII